MIRKNLLMTAHTTNESHQLVFRNGTCAVLLSRDCKFADAVGGRCKDAPLAIAARQNKQPAGGAAGCSGAEPAGGDRFAGVQSTCRRKPVPDLIRNVKGVAVRKCGQGRKPE